MRDARPVTTTIIPKKSTCFERTQPNHRMASAIGTAITFRKVSIQGPGFGSHAAQAGKMQRSSHGSDIPRPNARKTATATGTVSVNA